MTLPRTHTLLGESREYQVLDPSAQLAMQAIWRRGAPDGERTWRAIEGGTGDAVDVLLTAVRHRGQLLGPGSREWLAAQLRVLERAGLVVLVEREGRVVELAVCIPSAERAWRARMAARDADGLATPRRPREAPASARASAPADVDHHRWRAFDAWKCRLSEAEQSRPFEELWQRHGATYRPRRRATDLPYGAPVVTDTSPAVVAESVTTPPPSSDKGCDNGVTAPSERVGREKSGSFSPSGGFPEKTSQTPPAREPDPCNLVTGTVVTTDVTSPPPPAVSDPSPPASPPPPASELTPGFVWGELKRAEGRIGTSGKRLKQQVFDILVEEGVTQAEVRALAELGRRRELYGLLPRPDGTRAESVSLGLALDRDAKVLYTWIDQAKHLASAAAPRARRPAPVQQRLGTVADNTVAATPVPPASATPAVPRLSGLSFGPQRSMPAAPPAAAVGEDKPP